MEEYLIIPKIHWEQIMDKNDPEKIVVDQNNITDATKNLLIENLNMKQRYEDKKMEHQDFDTKILTNTLPKNVRNDAENLLNTLLNQKIISIGNNGGIKNLKSNNDSQIDGEDFMRNIFIPNSSVKKHAFFYGNLLEFIPNHVIRNKKLIRLKQENDEEKIQFEGETEQNPLFNSWEFYTDM